MVKLGRIVSIGLFLALLGASGINRFAHRFDHRFAHVHAIPENPLYGVVIDATLPKLSPAAWFNGDTQRQFEEWFNQTLSLRGYLSRLDNSLDYWVFRQTAVQSTTRIGLDGVLFRDSDLRYYNTDGPLQPAREITEQIAVIAEAARLWRQRGKAFVLIVSPSKAFLNPEAVPWEWKRELGQPRPSDLKTYGVVISELKRQGVPFIDGRAVDAAGQARLGRPMFPNTGLHWNRLAACLVMEAAAQLVEEQIHKSLGHFDCDSAPLDSPDDFDLLELANIWGPAHQLNDPPLPEFNPEGPTLLMDGSSFGFASSRELRRARGLSDLDMLWNNISRWREDPHSKQVEFKPLTPEWKQLVLSRDIIMIDLLEVQFYPPICWGFGQQLVDTLKSGYVPAPVQPALLRAVPPRFGPGFYAPEGSWRWMGKRGEIVLSRLPGEGRIRLRGWAPTELLKSSPTLHVTFGGQVLDDFVVPAGHFEREWRIPLSMQAAPSTLLVLETSATAFAPGDVRELGFSVESLEWTSADKN